MNKAELIAQLAEDAGITKVQANAALDSFVDTVTKTLKKGDKVTLVGFGTFSVSKRAARTGRNPQTGEAIKIKAKKVARFKPGKELSEKIKKPGLYTFSIPMGTNIETFLSNALKPHSSTISRYESQALENNVLKVLQVKLIIHGR